MAFRVLIADDHEIARLGVQSVLESSGRYEVCGVASDGRIAVQMARLLTPDLVVLDIGIPIMNGLTVARHILALNRRQRILFFTEQDSEHSMRRALGEGVRGYVLKADPAGDLLKAADALQQGRMFLTPRMTEIVLAFAKSRACESPLSEREREIVQLVAEGHDTKQMAKFLCLSPKTIETHRTNLRRKLQIRSTAELVLYALRNEIVRIRGLRSPTRTLPGSRNDFYRSFGPKLTSQPKLLSDNALCDSTSQSSSSLTSAAQPGAHIENLSLVR